jgi:hypothetical protein
MTKSTYVFLSYSRQDKKQARALADALKQRGLNAWLDERSIPGGAKWFMEIDRGIRGARAVIVLISASSRGSEWVTYEYALATGARIPVIAVVDPDGDTPQPLRQFQIVRYTGASSVAGKVHEGIRSQSRSAGRERAAEPRLVAKFLEENGELCYASGGRTRSICMELWVEQAPSQTTSVAFDIPDSGFQPSKWAIRRPRGGARTPREFLTDDMNSYGDVEICSRGTGRGNGSWYSTTRLYEALMRYYRGRPRTPSIRRALLQIRAN